MCIRDSSATLADPASRRIGASLNGAVATMTDIADQSAAAFAYLARAGALRINSRDLPRELVAGDPNLAHAWLHAALVRAPVSVTDALLANYSSAQAHVSGCLAGAATPPGVSTRPDEAQEEIGRSLSRT